MNPKTDKELAVEATIEFTKAWCSSSNKAISVEVFVESLNRIYEAIGKLS